MGPSNLLSFAFCGILIFQVNAQITLDDCCANGQEWAGQRQDCRALASDSQMCRIAQEQCCIAAQDDNYCTTGINLAKQHGECETLYTDATSCEAKNIKRCCNCCLLGKNAQQQGLSCEQNLSLGYECGLVYRACCVEGQETGTALLAVQPPQEPATSEQDDPYLNDQCRGAAHCSQQCRVTESGATCSCFQGYKLKPDGHTCEDINECLLGSHNCRSGERCINTKGAFRCQREVSCGTGYELTDSNNCQDIDECETGTHNCAPDFACQNTQGSFRCKPLVQCGEGFIQDAQGNCIDINECMRASGPCPSGQVCINTVGSFSCQRNSITCGRGYHLNEEGTRCVDINECTSLSQPCGPGHACINVAGTFRCECSAGYYFDSISRSCVDTNECRRYPGRLCAHKCENTPGSYHCSCTTGFKLGSDGRNCEDLNECESNPCSQECANVYGSYQCYCRRGYQLSDVDGITCEDIDECALPTGGHICSYRCHNIPGSFHCTCPTTGYTLAPNGRSCQDIDECVTGTHNCTGSETCFNVQGHFKCLLFECPDNYRKSGEARCERLPCNQNKECQGLPMRITYYHLTFPTNMPVPTNVFRMGPSNAVPGDDILLTITGGNDGGFFTTQKVNSGGVVAMQKPITQPQDFVLTVEMTLFRHGTVNTFLAKIFVFVTAEQPEFSY
ncbi:fibulin-1 isoform X2 [Polyodon spathula]|uniref:fibulin-1 isoform X2 n=1 Tax=Polyodon spathula TaxID=7913 RepID=UPI001B7F155B|nr:fibulin-1 isoform X2 [Polyodon spathula]